MKNIKKRFFASHKKSSAMFISIGFHLLLLVVAVYVVAVSTYKKDEVVFQPKQVKRKQMRQKQLKVPTKSQKKPKPKLRKRMVVSKMRVKVPNIVIPEISGVKGGIGNGTGTGDGLSGLGFSIPEFQFFDTKAKGGKICFLVHFGIATTERKDPATGKYLNNPYTRMTAYMIRSQLSKLIDKMPEEVLFNVACFWQLDTDAMSPTVLAATPANKQMVRDWMKHANPLEGNYKHNFQSYKGNRRIRNAKGNWPTKVDGLSMPSVSWVYPYVVPNEDLRHYVPDAHGNFQHWNRAVAWAILTQKPDTIFLLTNNYVGDCFKKPNPMKMRDVFKKMLTEVYGADKRNWPTFNVVVLKSVGKKNGLEYARTMLKDMFGPLIHLTSGNGSILRDITKYMDAQERAMYKKYKAQYAQ